MEPHLSTTPFGRRSLTLAHVASQAIAKARPPEKAVHKWQVFRAVCAAKTRVGVSERALAVLNALLSFHPETALTGEDLVVFPSNAAAGAARPWHGAGDAPSPASGGSGRLRPGRSAATAPTASATRAKGRGGEIEMAFGFDLSPTRRARGRIRGVGRRGPGRRARAQAGARAHHASAGATSPR